MSAALDPLGVAVLPPGLAEGADGWNDLPWTVRYAIASADARQHFLVRGDEVDVFVYGSERQAEHEAQRIRGAIGTAPLTASPDSALAGAPAAYFVAGPLVVRHRGADPEVRSRLTAVFGPLDRTTHAGGHPTAFAGVPCLYTYACPQQPGERPGAPHYPQYQYETPLYLPGENAPAWTVPPTFSRGGVTPQPAPPAAPTTAQPAPRPLPSTGGQ